MNFLYSLSSIFQSFYDLIQAKFLEHPIIKNERGAYIADIPRNHQTPKKKNHTRSNQDFLPLQGTIEQVHQQKP